MSWSFAHQNGRHRQGVHQAAAAESPLRTLRLRATNCLLSGVCMCTGLTITRFSAPQPATLGIGS
jgi:hypothetical protein